MTKTIISLNPPATFKVTVCIPAAGEPEGLDLSFTFKRRDRVKLQGFLDHAHQSKEQDASSYEVDLILSMADGWGLEEPLDAENVLRFVQLYPAGAAAILEAYVSEHTGTRQKAAARG